MAELLLGCWPFDITDEIERLLQPAANLADGVIERGPAWTVFTVHDGAELIAAANVRRTVDGIAEVVLVGGTRFREWLRPLDDTIGKWARDEGCTALRAFGRKGWAKVLGWQVIGRESGMVGYERAL